MKDHRLTERQRLFAEQHYSVLEDFLRERELPFDEYYDVVVFRFLGAVKHYDECSIYERDTFENIAANHMRLALKEYFEALDRQEENEMFEAVYPYSKRYGDMAPDRSVNVCEEVCRRLARTSSPKRKYRLSYISTIGNSPMRFVVREVI